MLLAECDGQLVANCHIERQGESGYVGMFAVNPNRQDGGFGKAVLVEAVRMARERWHCRAMRMTVMKNAAN